MKKSSFIIGLMIITLFSLSSLLFAAEPPPVRIGFLYPLTGKMSAVGREALRGAQIAVDQVNEKGGIWNGRKIELVTADASDTEAARTETERLCTVEKVKAILGVYSSTLAFVAHAVADKHGVFFWESNAIAPRLRKMGHKYTFFFGPKASGYGFNSAQAIYDIVAPGLGIAPKDLRIAAVYQGTEWGKGSTGQAFIPKAKELGMKIVADEAYDPKSLDYSSLVQKIKLKNPDVVVFQSYIDDGFRLFRDARKNGLNPKVWFAQGAVNVEVPDAFEKFGDDMNYIMATNQVSGGNIRNLSPMTQAQFKDFLKRYKEKYGPKKQAEADIVYTAAAAFFEYVLPAAGSLDPEKLAAVAHDLSLPHTATARPGGLKFSSASDEFANQNLRAGVMVRQIFNGIHYTVWPKEIAEIEPILPSPRWGQRKIDQAEVEKRLLLPKEHLIHFQ
ncbi:MAG: ABC transporter substrate-binding protein [Deltaproteobacteria bacterium]|nr:ABC transporter substrate-binding protein [Deltaproteobacteria bacterium]